MINEIPNKADLDQKVCLAIKDPTESLESIREIIVDHIVENLEFDSEEDMEEKYDDAFTEAFNGVEEIIYDLDVNEINFKRLKDYIKAYYSYNAFNRIIMDFEDYMTEGERLNIIKKGRVIFDKELTKHCLW